MSTWVLVHKYEYKYEYYHFWTHEYEYTTSTRNSGLEYCEYDYRVRVPQPYLSPFQDQSISWMTIYHRFHLLEQTLGTKLLIKIQIFSSENMLFKMSSAKYQPSCFSLNVRKRQDLQQLMWCNSNLNYKLHCHIDGLSSRSYINFSLALCRRQDRNWKLVTPS